MESLKKHLDKKAMAFVLPNMVAAIQRAEENHPAVGLGPEKRQEVVDVVVGIIVAFGFAQDTPLLRTAIGLAIDGIVALINRITAAATKPATAGGGPDMTEGRPTIALN